MLERGVTSCSRNTDVPSSTRAGAVVRVPRGRCAHASTGAVWAGRLRVIRHRLSRPRRWGRVRWTSFQLKKNAGVMIHPGKIRYTIIHIRHLRQYITIYT